MGQTPSKPQPGAHIRVIGAGLPRTGTATLSAALALLLNGPVYHAGIQHILSYPDENPMKTAIKLLERTPIRNTEDRLVVLGVLRSLFDEGYIAFCDSPYAQFTPELLALYPNAVVICTIRNPQKWTQSMQALVEAGRIATGWRTSLLPIARLFPYYTSLITSTRWSEIYIDPLTGTPLQGTDIYDRHIQWLKEVVPEEKLFFCDVREGWEPLCKALNLPVPEDVQFPRVNDGDEVKRIARGFVRRGIVRWVMVLSTLVAVVAIAWRLWQTSR